jgi:hypothetical protein
MPGQKQPAESKAVREAADGRRKVTEAVAAAHPSKPGPVAALRHGSNLHTHTHRSRKSRPTCKASDWLWLRRRTGWPAPCQSTAPAAALRAQRSSWLLHTVLKGGRARPRVAEVAFELQACNLRLRARAPHAKAVRVPAKAYSFPQASAVQAQVRAGRPACPHQRPGPKRSGQPHPSSPGLRPQLAALARTPRAPCQQQQ